MLFITTANTLEGIPRPLLDRMEVLELSGYSDMEKQAIAREYLIPRQRGESGLAEEQLEISDEGLRYMIRRHTREAGVRELERVIGRVARKRARQVVEKQDIDSTLAVETLGELLGPEKFKSDNGRTNMAPGVAAGLAWTEAGGDILYVEATLTQKDEKVTLTGHLGQVMQESAKAARSYHLVDRREDRARPGKDRGLRCAHPCSRRGSAQGRAFRRRNHGHGAGLGLLRKARSGKAGDDGRADALGPRAPRRRHQGKDPQPRTAPGCGRSFFPRTTKPTSGSCRNPCARRWPSPWSAT